MGGRVVLFTEAYGVRSLGYCHLVVATMAVIMFGTVCRYDDASGLLWKNLRFVEDGSGFEITFEKRKNAQYMQGNNVLVSSCPLAIVCPVRLLNQLRAYTGASEELHVFRGFNGRLVAKSPGRTEPRPLKITYDQFGRYLGLWFSGVLGTSVASFRKQFGTQSGRSGSASAVANAGVPCELWGQHGDWQSKKAHMAYMKSDVDSLLSVSRAAMRLPEGAEPAGRSKIVPAGALQSPPVTASDPPRAEDPLDEDEDVRIAEETAGARPLVAGEDLPPDVVGVPSGAFRWS